MTKFSINLPTVSQISIFIVPYLAYLSTELFGMSSIFAIVVCGILMKDYVKANISNETRIFTKQAVKAFAQCTENLAFFLLGITSIIGNLHWDFAFIGFSLACCLCYRIIAIIIQLGQKRAFGPPAYTLS
uniref:Cation/H+ exchanger domain-containing protein n=1 Tax=Panagrolaimus davidi TaxID=227884 RepID=A0A914R134_9BILA